MKNETIVLDRVSATPKMLFFGFKQTKLKKGVTSNFNSNMWSTRYASIGDFKANFEQRLKNARDKFNFSVDAKTGKVTFDDTKGRVCLSDLIAEFSITEAAIVYKYITAAEYDCLRDSEKRAYTPCVTPVTNFYQINPTTGEVIRDEAGHAIIAETGAGYYTDAFGDILFRTSIISEVDALEEENKMIVKPLDKDVLEALAEFPSALDAVNKAIEVDRIAVGEQLSV